MAPNPKIQKAFTAMKELGIPQDRVKPVLKKLIITYEKNWALIEEDNFRALADAIFEEQEAEEINERKEKKKNVEPEEDFEDEEEATIEPERPLKRLRRKGEGGPSLSPSGNSDSVLDGTSLKNPRIENGGPTHSLAAESPTTMHAAVQKNLPLETDITRALIVPKDEPFTDVMPLGMIHPASNLEMQKICSREVQETQNTSQPLQIASSLAETQNSGNDGQPLTNGRSSENMTALTQIEPPAIEIASSPLGEVKISLTCSPALGEQNFHLPSLEELRKSMEEKCLRSYKILDPNFNVINLMNDMCSCFLDLATKSPNQTPESLPYLRPNLDVLKRSAVQETVFGGTCKETFHIPLRNLNGEVQERCAEKPSKVNGAADDCGEKIEEGLVVVPECQVTADEWRALNDVNDITKGEEPIEIPWVNFINNEFPPAFHYLAQSIRYQNASVNFSLSGISDAQCCSACFGDCLASPVPCACACQNGAFAYTSSGLLREEFLEECISMTRDPKNQCIQTCKVCPLEKAKSEEQVEPCKGHLKRKIIKECWIRCGCNKQCGNRVVQRGVRKKLQVFLTPDGKGWGLRTLEKLPKGTFICEYAGEILTISELYDRNSENNTYPIMLDAYWGSDEGSNDDEALCLDSMRYGNISRFINHRCLDANLIEVPVEVETPEHHYYHLAFFTAREIKLSRSSPGIMASTLMRMIIQ